MGSWLGNFGDGGVADPLYKGLGLNNPYQASNPYAQQYLQTMADQQGAIYGGQQQLASQLQNLAAGQGPNPAQLQYQQNVGQNIAGAQGLMSSQRGINPGLAAKMGMNAANQANLQAANQAAQLQAQQQLGAMQGLGSLYGQMQSGNLGYQNLYNNANQNAQQLNAQAALGNQAARSKLIGGIMQGASAAASHYKGGEIQGMFDGGMAGPQSSVGKMFAQMAMGGGVEMLQGGHVPGRAQVSGDSPKNDTVPAILSPGEIVIPRSIAQSDDAADKSKAFVQAILERRKSRGSK